MPSLLESQRALQGAILAQQPGGKSAAGGAERMRTYHHAYRARLGGALRMNYPALAQLLGDEAFEAVANEYARARPSRHFSIRWHGAELGASLERPALKDLARMEWAIGSAFDAPDATPLDEEHLAEAPVEEWSELPLGLHPSVCVLTMAWSVEAQWEAMRESLDDYAQPEERAHALIVWRKELQSHWRIAALDEARALRELGMHASLAAACEGLTEESAPLIGGWFAGWVREGLLVGLAPAPR